MMVFVEFFRLACKTNHVQKDATVWILSQLGNKMLVNALNTLMCTADESSFIAASMCNRDTRSRKVIRSYLKVENNVLKKFGNY